MLKLEVPAREMYDYRTEEFITIKPVSLKLEHSLLSVSKWESIYHKCFLDTMSEENSNGISPAEFRDYVRCMTVNDNVPPLVYECLTSEELEKISEYIADPMSATTINRHGPKKARRGGDKMTSEMIYYYMIASDIPFECQKWHLNRLLKLITICGIKNAPAQKMSKRDIMARNMALNAQRRAKYHTKG